MIERQPLISHADDTMQPSTADDTSLMLDFSEIPPPLHPSADTDAFEKFAKQYFEEVEGATIWQTVGRGPDGGVDLIIEQDGQRHLVSCKHPFKTKSVSKDDELDPYGRMQEFGCTGFICFYAGIPSSRLVTHFVGVKQRHPDFQPRVLNERDIERGLLSYQNAAGWLLTARWFPRSYAKLFSQLVHPIAHYKDEDIVTRQNREIMSLHLDGGVKMLYSAGPQGSADAKAQARATMLEMANERKTEQAFDAVFLARIGELANLYPGSFVQARFAGALTSRSIFPSWDLAFLSGLMCRRESSLKQIHNICLAWSLWDKDTAQRLMRAVEVMYWMDWDEKDGLPASIEQVAAAYAERNNGADMFSNVHTEYDLSYHSLSSMSSTLVRGYFAGILCFAPSLASCAPDETTMTIRLATEFGELGLLQQRLDALTEQCSRDDRDYVRHRGYPLREQLASLRIVRSLSKEHWQAAEAGLACFSAAHTEPWAPDTIMNPHLARLLRQEIQPAMRR